MFKDHAILGCLWLLYCAVHSLLANTQIRLKIEYFLRIRDTDYRVGYNVFALVSLAILLFYHLMVASFPIFRSNSITDTVAILLIISGMTIMVICIRKYFIQLSGLKYRNKPVLETKGLHRHIRHPLYLGTFIFLTGLFILFPLLSNFIAVIIIIIYTVVGIQFEEKKLVSLFGEDYIRYQKEVPMIIPFFK